MKKVLIATLIVAVLAGLGVVFLVPRGGRSAVTFRSEAVRRGEIVATAGGTGTLEPEDVVDVGSQVAGLIKEFGVGADGKPIDYGSPVEEGTVLAKIDDSLFSAKAEQSRALLKSAEQKVIQAKAKVDVAVANTKKAEADLKSAVAKSNQSTRDWGRVKASGGAAGGAVSGTESDAALSAYEINLAAVGSAEAALMQCKASEADARAAVGDADAAVATAKAVLAQDLINVGYCTIKSTVKGTIIDRRVTNGQTVQASFNTPSLFLIAKDLKRMVVWASVNESDIGLIRQGQKVKFTVDAYPNEAFDGTVGRIRLNATNTQNVVVFTVEVKTDNPSGRLLPYMTATLKFELDRRANALLVPNAAVRYRPSAQVKLASGASAPGANTTVVWVEESGSIRPVPVTLGITDGIQTEVTSGELVADSQVIVAEVRAGNAPAATDNPFATKMGGGKR